MSKLSMGFKQWQSNSLLKRRKKSCWLQESLNSDKNLQFWIAGIIVWITDFYSQYQVNCPQERRPFPNRKSIKLLRWALKAWKASIPWREIEGKNYHFSIWSKQPNLFLYGHSKNFPDFSQIFFFTLSPIPLLSFVFTWVFPYHFSFELPLTHLLFALNAFVHHLTDDSTKNTPIRKTSMAAGPYYCIISGQDSETRLSDSNFKAFEHQVPSTMFYHFWTLLESPTASFQSQ